MVKDTGGKFQDHKTDGTAHLRRVRVMPAGLLLLVVTFCCKYLGQHFFFFFLDIKHSCISFSLLRLITTKAETHRSSQGSQNFVCTFKYPSEVCSVAAAYGRKAELSEMSHLTGCSITF